MLMHTQGACIEPHNYYGTNIPIITMMNETIERGYTVNWENFFVEKCMTLCIINVEVHGKGLFVRKLFNMKIHCTKYF